MGNITVLFHVSFLLLNKSLVVSLSDIIGVNHRLCIKKNFQIYSSIYVRLLIILQITPCIRNHLWWTQYMETKGQHALCACAQICRNVCISRVFSEYQTEFFYDLIFLNKKWYCSCWGWRIQFQDLTVSIEENYICIIIFGMMKHFLNFSEKLKYNSIKLSINCKAVILCAHIFYSSLALTK